MSSNIPMKSRGLSYKLVVAYAMMYVVPMLYLLYAVSSFLEKNITFDKVVRSPALMVLVLAIGTGMVMSFAAFLLMYRAVKPIKQVTKDAEMFLRQLDGGNFQIIHSKDEAEKLSHYITRMITELRKNITEVDEYAKQLDNAQRDLAGLTLKDSLTGLYPQAYIKERLHNEVMRAGEFNHSISVALIDLDDFNEYNEAYTHTVGDRALVDIAGLITENMRTIDVPTRYGGEQFLLIMPEAGKGDAFHTAEKIRNAIAAHRFSNTSGAITKEITVSIGTAGFPECRAVDTVILAKAEENLQEAKRAGKNNVWPVYSDTTVRRKRG